MEDKLQKIVNQYIDDTDQQLEVINIMTEEIKKTQKTLCLLSSFALFSFQNQSL